MISKNYEIFKNKKYIDILHYLIQDSEYRISFDDLEAKHIFKNHFLKHHEKNYNKNKENKSFFYIYDFFSKSVMFLSSPEFFIFCYYSEFYDKYYIIAIDSEGVFYILSDNIINFTDNIFIADDFDKSICLNYREQCKKNYLLDSIYKEIELKDIEEDPYLKTILLKYS